MAANSKFVIPAQAGIHLAVTAMDSRFRGNDGSEAFAGMTELGKFVGVKELERLPPGCKSLMAYRLKPAHAMKG